MLMKIITYVVIALLVLVLGAAVAFYFTSYKPMTEDYARMKAGLPELDKARAELKKIKEQEKKETAWLSPVIDTLNAGLADEIKAGKAEVFPAGNRVIVNIAEDALFMPGSYTFLKDSQQRLRKLDSLMRDEKLKGKTIIIGNTTDPVPAHGKGRKRIPAKDARTLAADRSSALVKYLEKSGVDQNALVAAAYSSKQPDIGFAIKTHKTVLIIENPPTTPPSAPKRDAAPSSKASTTSPSAPQSKAIPIQPQPKTH